MLSERKIKYTLPIDPTHSNKFNSFSFRINASAKKSSKTASPYKGGFIEESHKQFNLVRDHALKRNVLSETYRMDVKLNRHRSASKNRNSMMSSYDFELMKFKRPIIPKSHKAKQPKGKVSPGKSEKLLRSKKFIPSEKYLKALNQKLEGTAVEQDSCFKESR